MFVCCVLSGRGLCDEVITRPEESYWLWRVVVYDHENLVDEEAIARAGLQSQRKNIILAPNDFEYKIALYQYVSMTAVASWCLVHFTITHLVFLTVHRSISV
jgi:hypothetical protein